MKSLFFLFLSLIIISFCEEEEFPIENNITVLTEATFDKALEQYKHILVMFYIPSCGACQKFKLELEKAAAVLRKENLIVAKVNATVEKKLAEKYKVRGYPTIKFFKKGIAIDYTAGRRKKDIIDWVRKKSGPQAKILKTIKEVKNFKKDNEVCAIYFGKDAEQIEIYEKFAFSIKDYPFCIVEDEDIAKKFNAKPKTVVLFKKFDEKRNDLEIIKEKELKEFLDKHSQKKLGTLDEKTTERIFVNNESAIIYFGKKGEKWDEAEKLMVKIYNKLGGKLKVIMSEIKTDMEKNIAKYIGLKKKHLPSVIILDTRKETKKYIMEGEINEKNILDLMDGKKENLNYI